MQNFTSHDTSNTENWEIGWQPLRSQDKSPKPKLSLKHDEIGSRDTLNTTAMRVREVDARQQLTIQRLLLQKPPELWAKCLGGQMASSQPDPTLAPAKDGFEEDERPPSTP